MLPPPLPALRPHPRPRTVPGGHPLCGTSPALPPVPPALRTHPPPKSGPRDLAPAPRAPHLSRRRPRLPASSASLRQPRPSGARSKLPLSLRSSGSGRRLRVALPGVGSGSPEGGTRGSCEAGGDGARGGSPHIGRSRAGDAATAADPAGRIAVSAPAHLPLAARSPRRRGGRSGRTVWRRCTARGGGSSALRPAETGLLGAPGTDRTGRDEGAGLAAGGATRCAPAQDRAPGSPSELPRRLPRRALQTPGGGVPAEQEGSGGCRWRRKRRRSYARAAPLRRGSLRRRGFPRPWEEDCHGRERRALGRQPRPLARSDLRVSSDATSTRVGQPPRRLPGFRDRCVWHC